MKCSYLPSASRGTRCRTRRTWAWWTAPHSPKWASLSSSGKNATCPIPSSCGKSFEFPLLVAPRGATCDLVRAADDVRRCLTGGSVAALNLPRSTVLRRHPYGGIVASLLQTTNGGLLRVTTPDGAVSKAQPVNLHVARKKHESVEANKVSALSCYGLLGQMSTGWSLDQTPRGALNPLALTPGYGDHTASLITEVRMEDQAREKLRSPNYPAFGLSTAIERADALYKRQGKAAVTTLVAVKAWGYNSLNGRSLRTLGAMRQYGLLEDTGNKTVKLSQTALVILRDHADSAARKAALNEAARNPPIFATLFDMYAEAIPSDDAMVSQLEINSSYSGEAARKLISAFRDTLNLVGTVPAHDPSGAGDHEGEGEGGRLQPPGKTPNQKGGSMPALQQPGATPPYDLTLALMAGEHAILRIPRHMSEENYGLLTSLIDANLKAMKAALVSEPTAPATADTEL